MKLFILVLALSLSSISHAITVEEILSRADVSHKSCFAMSNSSMATVEKIRSRNFELTDDIVRKHIFCYSQETGFVNSLGELNREFIKRRVSQQMELTPEREQKLDECIAPKTPDMPAEEFTTRVAICIYKQFPNFVLM